MNRERLLNVLGVVILVVIWGTFVGTTHVALPPLSLVARDFGALVRSGALFADGLASLGRIGAGVAIATVVALLLAIPAALWPTFSYLFGGVIELIRPVPPLAWIPIAILAFGIGNEPAIAIVALGAFFPIWLGLQQGFTEVRGQHLLAARSFGANTRVKLFDVILPSVLPYAFHGFRLGVGLGWFCVVAAELMGANSGLGYGIQLNSLNLSMGKTYSYVVVIAALGAGMNFVLQSIEARVFRWHRLAISGDA